MQTQNETTTLNTAVQTGQNFRGEAILRGTEPSPFTLSGVAPVGHNKAIEALAGQVRNVSLGLQAPGEDLPVNLADAYYVRPGSSPVKAMPAPKVQGPVILATEAVGEAVKDSEDVGVAQLKAVALQDSEPLAPVQEVGMALEAAAVDQQVAKASSAIGEVPVPSSAEAEVSIASFSELVVQAPEGSDGVLERSEVDFGDVLPVYVLGAGLLGGAVVLRSTEDSDEGQPELIVDPGPGPVIPVTPVDPVTPEQPQASGLFDPIASLVEGFELDGPLVGVLESLQQVSQMALAPVIGAGFTPSAPGPLDGTDSVLTSLLGAVPNDLLPSLTHAVGQPAPENLSGNLIGQADLVTDALTVAVLDSPVAGVLNAATGGSSSSPSSVLNFVDNLVSGEQLATSLPPIAASVNTLPTQLLQVF